MVANMVKIPPLRLFSCIFFGSLKKKEYLCDLGRETAHAALSV